MIENEAWVEVELELHRSDQDEAASRMMEAGIPGWAVEEHGPHSLFRFWLLGEDLTSVLPSLLEDLRPIRSRRRALRSEPWLQHWDPIRVGRFWVESLGAPPSTTPSGCIPLRLAPALAFGGGEHPTTQLCLLTLPAYVTEGMRVLDVGSGSGILSIAAALLGAKPVQAVDIDPTARHALTRAARANAVEVDFLESIPPNQTFSLVIANILGPVLVELAPQILDSLSPGGHVILSGLRSGAESEVIEAYPALSLREIETKDGWALVVLRRQG